MCRINVINEINDKNLDFKKSTFFYTKSVFRFSQIDVSHRRSHS